MEVENRSVDYRLLIPVTEDDDSNFKLIKAITGKRCEVQRTRNGEEIVSLFFGNWDKADAILMDIKMSVMSDLDTTQHTRREDGTLPIIMQTAHVPSPNRENTMSTGASKALVKLMTLSTSHSYLSGYLPQLVWQDSTDSTSSPGTCGQPPGFFSSVRTQTAPSCKDFTEDSKKLMEDLNEISFSSVNEA